MWKMYFGIGLIMSLLVGVAYAHGGRLNSTGCHKERATGGYHCHNRPSKSFRSPSSNFRTPSYRPQRENYDWDNTRACKFRDWRISYSARWDRLLFEGRTTCRSGRISFSLYEQEGTNLNFLGEDRVQIWDGFFSSFLYGVPFNPDSPMIEYSISRWDQVEGLITSRGVLTVR